MPRPTGGKRFAWEHANPIPSPFPIQSQPHPAAPQAGGWSPAALLWGKPPRFPKTAQHKSPSTCRDAPHPDPATTTPHRLLQTRQHRGATRGEKTYTRLGSSTAWTPQHQGWAQNPLPPAVDPAKPRASVSPSHPGQPDGAPCSCLALFMIFGVGPPPNPGAARR